MNAGMLVLNIFLLLAGFVLLIKGADWFVEGASALAKRLGVPPIVIGLTIVAFGTSLPEAAVSLTAAVQGSSDLSLGNVVGSNISNILLIVGVCALIGKLPVKKNTLCYEIPFVILITVALLLMGIFDNRLSRIDAAVLLAFFAVFFVYLIFISKRGDGVLLAEAEAADQAEKPKERKLWLVIVLLVLGAAMVVGGGTLAVEASKKIAGFFGLSEAIIGLTIVAVGTSLPELVTSIIATRKGETDIAIGNVVGSNIFNILLVLGLTAMIRPIGFAESFLADCLIAIGAATLLFLCLLVSKKRVVGRVGGALMTAGFAGYWVFLFLREFL